MPASTPDQIRAAHAYAALVVATQGEAYLAIFERLETEVAALDARGSALERARRVAATRLAA